jgi:hypothetical protein
MEALVYTFLLMGTLIVIFFTIKKLSVLLSTTRTNLIRIFARLKTKMWTWSFRLIIKVLCNSLDRIFLLVYYLLVD